MTQIAASLLAVAVEAISKFIADKEGRPQSEVKKDILAELIQTDKDLLDAEAREDAARRTP